jgi:hypothetical protein
MENTTVENGDIEKSIASGAHRSESISISAGSWILCRL